MTRAWTLALDESGRFEEGHDDAGWLVGGVLLPGSADETRERLQPFRDWCTSHFGWPLHANKTPPDRTELRQKVASEVEALDGEWIFVAASARESFDRQAALGLYVRMLAATVDLAARIVARRGGGTLDARPAQRTIAAVKEALAKGYVSEAPEPKGPPRSDRPRAQARVMSEAEVRSALDSFAREPEGWLGPAPSSGSIRADAAASFGGVHPGVVLADIGCNAMYDSFRKRAGAGRPQFLEPLRAVHFVSYRAVGTLRAIDRALREDPPDLVRAGRLVHGLRGDALGQPAAAADALALREGSATCATFLWQDALEALPRCANLRPLYQTLAAHAEAHLLGRSGAYEGTWLALQGAWAGRAELAAAGRATTDRVLAAKLWRLTVECANHRGDQQAADKATTAFNQVLAQGRSYFLLAEEFLMRNLQHVTLQNQLPTTANELAALEAALDDGVLQLKEVNERAELLLSASDAEITAPADTDSEAEGLLWRSAADRAPVWHAPDRERGMSYGSMARTCAFRGRLDEALALALRARSLFSDSAFERRFNACVIARVELERGRLAPVRPSEQPVLSASLTLSGARALLEDGALEVSTCVSERFALDVALRALLWTERSASPALARVLFGDALYGALSRSEMRSHPTELVARHLGELARRTGLAARATQWFELSIALTNSAQQGTTLARFSPFTKRLAADPQFTGEGPPGSLLNPTFEYR